MHKSQYLFVIINLFLATVGVCQSTSFIEADLYQFQDFVRQFNRNYSSIQQYTKRRIIFEQNYQKIIKQQESANGTYHVTVNNFTDWSEQELNAYFTYKPLQAKVQFSLRSDRLKNVQSYPSSLDYRAMGKVSDVKDQGQCGDCWAFSTTGLYESLLMIQQNQNYDLAEQYVLDCTSGSSCNGGIPNDALKMLTVTGIPQQSSYPYKQQNNYYGSGICQAANKIKLTSAVSSVKHYNAMTDAEVKQALTDHGPLAIGIYATSSFSSYSSGVYSGCPSSSSYYINHAVLLVGYTANGDWIVKNSWGTNWGDNGYVTISKNADCGLKTFVDVVTLADPAPSPSPSPSPSPTPDPNVTYVNYTANLIDSYGDGWNGLVIGVRQGGVITSTFGQGFTSGSTYGPVTLLVKQNVYAQLVVVQMGSKSTEAFFDLYDEKNQTIYTRECRAGPFNATVIFQKWCPGTNCTSPTLSFVYVQLMDSWGDGWNGNTIGLKQNGNIVATFGAGFNIGHAYGPVLLNISYGIQAQIIVNTLGSWTSQVGFIIRDQKGNSLFSRLPGSAYLPTTIFGTFCLGCTNNYPVRMAGETIEQIINKYLASDNTTVQNQGSVQATANPILSVAAIIIICIISFFTLFFMGTTIAIFKMWRNEKKNKQYTKYDHEQSALLTNQSLIQPQPSPMRAGFGSTNQFKYRQGPTSPEQIFINT